MQTMQPTEHEKSEWARMAQAAYKVGRNDIGHRYSTAAATTRIGQTIPAPLFHDLQEGYRAWLVFNLFPVDDTTPIRVDNDDARITLGQFFRINGDGIEAGMVDPDDIRATLAKSGTYQGGGGASAVFTITTN